MRLLFKERRFVPPFIPHKIVRLLSQCIHHVGRFDTRRAMRKETLPEDQAKNKTIEWNLLGKQISPRTSV
ncbi:hypothetical protein DAMNIGENAA_02970 [Desulforhabdus amnigena]|jgi:hypothetical protein|uniref:Uncharacterized protein n=1 Tax=Desulforhabdus amnigena TaxID=40218 RepID=A0A9W6CUS0_9BACT|nr:hypothetical protein DAMNIGENAA_02970 [Desulforhabdus amnigena]